MKQLLKYIPVWTMSVLLAAMLIAASLCDMLPDGIVGKLIRATLFFGLTLVMLADYVRYCLPERTAIDVELACTAAAVTLSLVSELLPLTIGKEHSIDYGNIVAAAIGAFAAFAAMRLRWRRQWRRLLLRRKYHRARRHNHS